MAESIPNFSVFLKLLSWMTRRRRCRRTRTDAAGVGIGGAADGIEVAAVLNEFFANASIEIFR